MNALKEEVSYVSVSLDLVDWHLRLGPLENAKTYDKVTYDKGGLDGGMRLIPWSMTS